MGLAVSIRRRRCHSQEQESREASPGSIEEVGSGHG